MAYNNYEVMHSIIVVIIPRLGSYTCLYKCKKHFIKMLKDVDMVVPKIKIVIT